MLTLRLSASVKPHRREGAGGRTLFCGWPCTAAFPEQPGREGCVGLLTPCSHSSLLKGTLFRGNQAPGAHRGQI